MVKGLLVALSLCLSSIATGQTVPNPFTDDKPTESATESSPESSVEVLPIPPIPPTRIPPPRQNASPFVFNKNPGPQPACPEDRVVWINLNSQTYHAQDSKYFGNTRNGRFLCEAQAKAGGAKLAHAGQVRH